MLLDFFAVLNAPLPLGLASLLAGERSRNAENAAGSSSADRGVRPQHDMLYVPQATASASTYRSLTALGLLPIYHSIGMESPKTAPSGS